MPLVFEFKAETDEESSPWLRVAALSGAFIVMVGLTLAAMVVIGFVLFCIGRTIQD